MLKKLLFCFLFFSAFVVNAQTKKQPEKTEIKNPSWIFTVHPGSFIFGKFRVGATTRLSKKVGLNLNFAYGYGDNSDLYDVLKYSEINAEGQLRYFPMKNAPEGFYTGVYSKYKIINFNNYSFNIDPYIEKYTANSLHFGVLMGYQIIAYKIFTMDCYFGGGPRLSKGDSDVLNRRNIFGWNNGVGPNAGLNIGIAIE